MPQIYVWKCPKTSKYFEDKAEYKAHLKKVAKANIVRHRHNAIKQGVLDVIRGCANVNSFQELAEYIAAHNVEFLMAGLQNSTGNGRDLVKKAIDDGKEIIWPRFKYINIITNWKDHVSNTHTSPRGGVSSMSTRKLKDGSTDYSFPTGYPGWTGNISTMFDDEDRIIVANTRLKRHSHIRLPSFSDMVRTKVSGIYTGTGNGGNHSRYGTTLFASDFPEMEKMTQWFKLKHSGKRIDKQVEEFKADMSTICNGNYTAPELV